MRKVRSRDAEGVSWSGPVSGGLCPGLLTPQRPPMSCLGGLAWLMHPREQATPMVCFAAVDPLESDVVIREHSVEDTEVFGNLC